MQRVKKQSFEVLAKKFRTAVQQRRLLSYQHHGKKTLINLWLRPRRPRQKTIDFSSAATATAAAAAFRCHFE
jgi:hypothetical protein